MFIESSTTIKVFSQLQIFTWDQHLKGLYSATVKQLLKVFCKQQLFLLTNSPKTLNHLQTIFTLFLIFLIHVHMFAKKKKKNDIFDKHAHVFLMLIFLFGIWTF